MLRPNYCTFEHANTSFSIIWPSLVKETLVFRSKNVFSFSKIRFFSYYFSNLFEKCLIIIPMLRLNYCTFEFANTLFSLMRPSLVEGEDVFSIQKSMFSFAKISFFSKNMFFFFFLRISLKNIGFIPMLRLNYCTFEFPNTLFSITWPSFVERDFSFCSKNMYSISKKGIFFVYFRNTLKNVSLIPMLRPNYCTFEHANTSFSIIWPSLVEGDFSFSIKKRVFFFKNKVILIILFPNLFEKCLIIIPMLRLSYCTFEFANTLFSIMRPSFVERDFRF